MNNRRRRSSRSAVLLALDEAENAIRCARARMAAGAALALALDGSIFGWALRNLHGPLGRATFAISALTIVAATFGVAVAVARMDRRFAKIRRIRRLLDFQA